MAASKSAKKVAGIISVVPECPVCMDPMSAPIFQCKSGHSLCSVCTRALCPPICPLCRQEMTQIRNLTLEDIVSKAKVPCDNKAAGCVYTMTSSDMDDHLKECIFRKMDCPLGVVFGKCSWNGNLKEMKDHFQERHPENCNVNFDSDIELTNINVNQDDRRVYLMSSQSKFLFILTIKIDTLQKMAYWCLQHIGSKKAAMQHLYDLHLTSRLDDKRKVVYTEHCFNDALKADEVFRLGKCAMLPINALAHYVKDKKMSFKVLVRKMGPPAPKNKNDGAGNDNKPKGPFKPRKNFNKAQN